MLAGAGVGAGLLQWHIGAGLVLAAVVVLVVSGRGRALQPDRSRPAILREEGSA